MTTEPAAGTSAATDVSLLYHTEALMKKDERFADAMQEQDLRFAGERDRRYEDRWKAAEKALGVSETNAQLWRDNANEWRTTVEDLTKLLPSRAELAALEARVEELKDARLRDDGGDERVERRRSSFQPFQVAILSAIVAGVVAIIVAVVLANVLTATPT